MRAAAANRNGEQSQLQIVAVRIELVSRCLTVVCWLNAVPAFSQQIPDSSFIPHVARPEYPTGTGPVVCQDGAHNNVHTTRGQYLAFSTLAAADGYRVESLDGPLSRAVLDACSILVIASPRNAATLRSRSRPILNAYTADEVAIVKTWVEDGGSLLLITDHMPVVASMRLLIEAFGFKAIDGFATTVADTTSRLPIVYRRSDGSLRAHAITDGRSPAERVDSIATFTGAAFQPEATFATLWQLPKRTIVIVPNAPWEFPASAPRLAGVGLAQGAARAFGGGRIVFSAEAAMFTAQWEDTPRKAMGMNHPAAKQNAQFVLNVLHWLSAQGGSSALTPALPRRSVRLF